MRGAPSELTAPTRRHMFTAAQILDPETSQLFIDIEGDALTGELQPYNPVCVSHFYTTGKHFRTHTVTCQLVRRVGMMVCGLEELVNLSVGMA